MPRAFQELVMNLARSRIAICLALAIVTLGVYWPATHYDFINYDDTDYVTENRSVLQGLTWQGVRWAFQTDHAANWHPLTWLSHMLDVQLFGVNPGGHHLTNVLLHTANALLLFGLLARLTGRLWPSAIVAALFAWHPLHVESVAWVAERKDVLSTFFGLLALWAYAKYAEFSRVTPHGSGIVAAVVNAEPRPPGRKPARKGTAPPVSRLTLHAPRSTPSSLFYALALLLFACSLMSKPMLVTLPFLLLLLDYWPLGRLQFLSPDPLRASAFKNQKSKVKNLLPLFREKLPFLALSLVSALITLAVQGHGGAVRSLQSFPFFDRLANAWVSYVRYLLKAIWPAHLAFFYPHPIEWPWWQVLGAAALLALVTVGVILARRQPYLLVGWLWFLGMLLPAIGLVQVGFQSMADRYSYLPLVGIFIMFVWGMSQASARWRRGRVALACLAVVLGLSCAAASRRQLAHWQDGLALCQYALSVTADNWLAHDNLGAALERQNKFEEALVHFQTAFRLEAALKVNPDLPSVRYDLGTALARKGKLAEARLHLLRALEIQPDMAKAHHNLASVLTLQGSLDEALTHYQEALRLNPDYAEARTNLAAVLIQRQQWQAAAAHYHSGESLLQQQSFKEALQEFRDALQLRPDWPELLNNLAWHLATHPNADLRNGPEAVSLAQRACELTSRTNLSLLSTLAAAYAEAGRFPEALSIQQTVCDLAAARSQGRPAESFQRRLELYRSGQAYRSP